MNQRSCGISPRDRPETRISWPRCREWGLCSPSALGQSSFGPWKWNPTLNRPNVHHCIRPFGIGAGVWLTGWGCPTTAVLPDAVLERIAEQRPRDRDSLRQIEGLGPRALAKWGDALLRLSGADEPTLLGIPLLSRVALVRTGIHIAASLHLPHKDWECEPRSRDGAAVLRYRLSTLGSEALASDRCTSRGLQPHLHLHF